MAAAATAAQGSWGTGSKETIPVFRADHPFLFLIRHKPTGNILFMGRLTSPTGEELPGHVPGPRPDRVMVDAGGMFR